MTGIDDPVRPSGKRRASTRGGWRGRRHQTTVALLPELTVSFSPSPLEVEFGGQVAALLLTISEQERLAQAALSDPEDYFAWPSWSMDSGLSADKERFVEAWSPKRVVDGAQSLRHLVLVLQDWTATHRADADLDHALTVLATLRSL